MATPEHAVRELKEILGGGYLVSSKDVLKSKRIMELIFKILIRHGYTAFVTELQQIVVE